MCTITLSISPLRNFSTISPIHPAYQLKNTFSLSCFSFNIIILFMYSCMFLQVFLSPIMGSIRFWKGVRSIQLGVLYSLKVTLCSLLLLFGGPILWTLPTMTLYFLTLSALAHIGVLYKILNVLQNRVSSFFAVRAFAIWHNPCHSCNYLFRLFVMSWGDGLLLQLKVDHGLDYFEFRFVPHHSLINFPHC